MDPCPNCGGRMAKSIIDPNEAACMDCPFATYDGGDDGGPSDAQLWDEYAGENSIALATEILGPRPEDP